MPRSAGWCFTINNPDDIALPKQWSERCQYLVYQEEQGANGTSHLQGYIFFTVRKTFDWIKRLCPTAHWEAAKGSAEQNKAYCTKADTRKSGPWEIGQLPKDKGQGARSDLKRLYSAIEGGASRRKLFKEHTSCSYKYTSGISMHISLVKPPPPTSHAVELHVGPTGTGKTRFCNDTYPDHWATPLRQGKALWFDGYDGHKVVLIDDYNGEMPLVNLLRLLDRYVIQVPVKHGHAWWRPELVIITSNYELDTWYNYDNRQESLAALKRRITKVVRYTAAPAVRPPPPLPSSSHFHTVSDVEDSQINWPSINDVLS